MCAHADTAALQALAFSFRTHNKQRQKQSLSIVTPLVLTDDIKQQFSALRVRLVPLSKHATACDYSPASVTAVLQPVLDQFDGDDAVVFIHPHSLVIGPVQLSTASVFEADPESLLLGAPQYSTMYLLRGVLPPATDIASTAPVSFTFSSSLLSKYLDTIPGIVERVQGSVVVRFASESLPWHFFRQPVADWSSGVYLDQVCACGVDGRGVHTGRYTRGCAARAACISCC